MRTVTTVNGTGMIGGDLQDGRPAMIVGTRTKPLPTLGQSGFGSVAAISDDGDPAGSSVDPAADQIAAVTWAC